jgi:hypothetical protein
MAKKKAEELFGRIEDVEAVDEALSEMSQPVFGVAASSSGIVGSGKGKIVLCHKAVTKVLGHFPIHMQTIGDCVSHGSGTAVDVVKCVRIINKNLPEAFKSETATEPIYAASRIEIGRGRVGRGDGSVGAWAVKAMKKIGTVRRDRFKVGRNSVDLRRYSGNRAKQWGAPGAGVPDWLEPTAREHPIMTSSLIRSFEEAADALANGYPVIVCSDVGFGKRRDSQGFAKPGPKWPHCMVFIASDYKSRRSGLLCMNSWGPNWIKGPKTYDQPDGSFWVDAKVCDKMFSQNDSWSVSGFVGYPSQQGGPGDDLLLI